MGIIPCISVMLDQRWLRVTFEFFPMQQFFFSQGEGFLTIGIPLLVSLGVSWGNTKES